MDSQTTAHGLTTSDTIDKLLWPPDGRHGPTKPGDLRIRLYNAAARNGVKTIADVLRCSERDVRWWRNIGERSVGELVQVLARHGWTLSETDSAEGRYLPPAPRVELRAPDGLERAAWIGRQLDVLYTDDRVYLKNGLGTEWSQATSVEKRRRAWAWFRWATAAEAEWPRRKAGGFGFMSYPLPGSFELHLEGLNRLAHEELAS